jgi:molybdate transport system substrate-binding protein
MTTIRIMSAGAVHSMLTALGAEFEHQGEHRLNFTFNTAGALRERFVGGDIPDLLVLPETVIQALEAQGHFVRGSRTPLASTVTGVVVRKGAPLPDISTPEAFKHALLNAKSVSYTDPKAGGSSGIFFAGLLDRLGIAEEVNRKAVLGRRGVDVAQIVAEGRADLGTTFISEVLPIAGTQVVGPLPGELHNANAYTAAIPAKAAAPDAAAAFLRRLTDPAERQRWAEAGLEPSF